MWAWLWSSQEDHRPVYPSDFWACETVVTSLVEWESTKARPWDRESPVTFSRKTPISSSPKYSMSYNLRYFLPPLLPIQKLSLLPSRMTPPLFFEFISVSMGGQEDYGSQPHPKMNSEKRLLPVSSPEPSQSTEIGQWAQTLQSTIGLEAQPGTSWSGRWRMKCPRKKGRQQYCQQTGESQPNDLWVVTQQLYSQDHPRSYWWSLWCQSQIKYKV